MSLLTVAYTAPQNHGLKSNPIPLQIELCKNAMSEQVKQQCINQGRCEDARTLSMDGFHKECMTPAIKTNLTLTLA